MSMDRDNIQNHEKVDHEICLTGEMGQGAVHCQLPVGVGGRSFGWKASYQSKGAGEADGFLESFDDDIR